MYLEKKHPIVFLRKRNNSTLFQERRGSRRFIILLHL